MGYNKFAACNRKVFITNLVMTFGLLIAVSSCTRKDDLSYQVQTRQSLMLESISKDTSMSLTLAALQKAKLDQILAVYGPITFFAPDNNAFRRFFANQGKKGLDDFSQEEMERLMNYHILPTRLKSHDFIQGPQLVTTGKGEKITLDISRGYKFNTVANGKAKLYQTDIEYANGFIHRMDGVLDPPILTIGQFMAQNLNQYSIMYKGLQIAGLIDTLTNLTNSRNERIRLTLFAETNDVLTANGITTFENMPVEQVRKLMRNHIIAGDNSSANYTRNTPAFTPYLIKQRWDSAMFTLDGSDWIYFDLAGQHLINRTIDFLASDVLMRNGVIHNISKPLTFQTDPPRTQIAHVFWNATNYAYGIPNVVPGQLPAVLASSGVWRYYYEGGPAQNFLYMEPDGINDSLVTVVRGVKRGKYQLAINYKNGFNRGNYAIMYKTDTIGKYDFVNGLQFRQNQVLGTYDFRESGNLGIKFVCLRTGGLNVESMVLTPVE